MAALTTLQPHETRRIRQYRPWLLSFLGFFLVFGSWSFAAPYDGPADEVQHVVRAAGVVSGQIAPAPVQVHDGKGNPGMGAVQHVPAGLWSHASCWGFTPSRSASCARPIAGGPIEPVQTSAGRYNPLYYAAVGLPVRLWPGWTGLLLSRLISAALSAALLACSFTVLLRRSRYGLMLAGLLAAATPMLAHLAGAVNPNGLEIAAGIGLFAAGIPLLFGPAGASRTPLIWLFGVSSVLLVTLRSLGPLWFGFALLALLIPRSRAGIRDLWRIRMVRGWVLAISIASLLSMAWIVGMGTGALIPIPGLPHVTVAQATVQYINNWGRIYPMGLVGVAGWFDVYMPLPLYWIWISAATGLLLFAMVAGSRTDRWRLLVILFGGVVPAGVMQVAEVNKVGYIIGGRYMLPLLVGVPLFAAYVVEQRVVDARQARSLTRIFCLALLPQQLVLLVYAMVRWQRGANAVHLNPFTGSWHPPTGSVAPVVLMLAGIGLLAALFWTPSRLSPAGSRSVAGSRPVTADGMDGRTAQFDGVPVPG